MFYKQIQLISTLFDIFAAFAFESSLFSDSNSFVKRKAVQRPAKRFGEAWDFDISLYLCNCFGYSIRYFQIRKWPAIYTYQIYLVLPNSNSLRNLYNLCLLIRIAGSKGCLHLQIKTNCIQFIVFLKKHKIEITSYQ